MKKEKESIWSRIYKLLIINTLDTVSRIDTLVEGLIVSAFGVIITGSASLFFRYAAYDFSAEIATLGFYAYLAIFVYHMLKHEKDRKGYMKWGIVIMSSCLLVLLGFVILNKAFFIAGLDRGILKALPGIIAILLPLVAWEKLCEWTPVDETIRGLFE